MKRRLLLVLAVLVCAPVAACSSGPDTTLGPPVSATTGPTTTRPPATTRAAGTTTTTAVTTTTTVPAPPPPPAGPVAAEDAVVAVWTVWPAALGPVGPTHVRGFVPAADDAPPRDGESMPPAPAVPHGYTLANGGGFTARVSAYEFADGASAAAYAGQWTDYAGRPPVARHEGRTSVAVAAALPADGQGWAGLVLDRVEGVPGPSPSVTRTAVLVRAAGRRAYRVDVSWLGNATGPVPDVAPAARALAAAQDAHVAAGAITDARPGLGAEGTAGRVALVDTLLPWAALTGQPEIDPPQRWDEFTTTSINAMPVEAAADGPQAYAERLVHGDGDGPLYAVAVAFPDAAAADAAVARWNASEASFGPFAFADLGVTGDVTVADSSSPPLPEVPGAMVHGIDFQAAGSPLTVGGGWFAHGPRAYAVVVSYDEGQERSVAVAADLLRRQHERLVALGL